jgi:hypothetical protein
VRLLAWTAAGIAALAADGRAVRIDPETGRLSLGDVVPSAERADVLAAARTCGDFYLDTTTGIPDPVTGRSRVDIVLQHRKAFGDAGSFWEGSVLTLGSARVTNLDPAFSPDCQRIVFVAR